MAKARGGLSLLVVLAAGLLWTPSIRADSQVRIVRLSLVSGPVQIDRGDGFEKAILNMPITQGMKLWTQGESRAEVEFEDGATMRLSPGAKVDFEQLALQSSGAKASIVKVDGGKVYFNVPQKGENDFRVAFQGREVPLTRSVRFRLDVTPDQAAIAVFKGELTLGEHTKLKKNETATLDSSAGEKGSFQLAKGITPSPFDQWDAYRLQFNSEYASAGSKNVPYYYGRSDLNYYGSWGYVPGYGNLWRPFGYGYGWDPFDAGAWAWYPGWGYTWVSSYPWGWIPFRYGSWIWAPNYGWCWRPGGYSSWYVVPAVINPPPAFRPPQPPPVTTVTGTGGGAPRPHPPTIVVRERWDSGVRTPRLDSDDIRNPAGAPGLKRGVTTSVVSGVPAGSTAAPGGTAAAAQPPRPVRTLTPSSGPGMGRRPAALDDKGISRGFGGRMRDDTNPRFERGGMGAASPRNSGSRPATPRVSAPPAASRPSTPAPRPSSSHAPPSSPRPK